MKYLIVGSIGAVAPEIVRLYQMRHEKVKFTLFYFLISLVFAGLGGFLAVIMNPTNYFNAFYTGLCTPVIINTLLKKAIPEKDSSIMEPNRFLSRIQSFISFL